MLAQETVAFLGDHYGSTEKKDSALTVSAINLENLVPVAQALDTFSVVFLQWLSSRSSGVRANAWSWITRLP
jgi:hypothetical protein